MRRLLPLPIIAALLATPQSALGDDPVPTITVTGAPPSASPTAPSPSATEPTSVVGRSALAQFVAPTGNYDDAIRLTPSVLDVEPNGPGLGEAQILSIRGFVDGQYNVTFDGIPFADSDDFTHHSSAYFVTRMLDRVSVDRGPGDATTIGDATFGGTVALRSIAPADDASITPEISLASRATRLGGLLLDSGTKILPGGASAVLDLEGAESRGLLDNVNQRRGNLFARLDVPLGPTATLTLVTDQDRSVQGEPLGATRAQIAADGPSVALDLDPASQAYAPYNSSTYDTDISYAALSASFESGASLSDRLYSYGLDRHFTQGIDTSGETPNGTAFGPADVPGQYGRNGLRAWGDILRADQPLTDRVSLAGGFWLERQANSRSLEETDLTLGGVPNPVLDPVPGAPDSTAFDRIQHEDLVTFQPYLQANFEPRPWLRLTAGLKGALFARSVEAPIMEGTRLPTRADRTFGAPVPSFTAHLAFSRAWTAYLQVARGFLAPPLQAYDVSDPQTAAINPETTWNYQIGTTWHAGALTLGADLYEIDFDDAIGQRTVGGETVSFDAGGITYRGAEAEGTIPLGAGASLYASGSANHAHENGANGVPSGPAPDLPQATAAGGLLYHAAQFDASLLDRWTGGSYGDVGATNWIAPNHQLDLSVATGIAVTPHGAPIRLRAQVFNLLDSRKIDGFAGYTATAGTPLFWTQAGRSVFVTASATF